MNCVNRKLVKRLIDDPLSVAIMMNKQQLEHVVVTFISVLNKRKQDRGG
jgi:hypothetical protein